MSSITRKFIVNYLIISILPFCILGVIFYNFYINVYSSNIKSNMINTVQQMGITVDEKLNNIEEYMNLIFQDETIQEVLENYDFSNNVDLVKRMDMLYKSYDHYFNREAYLQSAAVFDITGGVYTYKDIISRNIIDYRNSSWFKNVMKSNGQIFWIGPEKITDINKKQYNCFTVARLLKDIKDQNPLKPVGVAYLSFSEDMFSSIYNETLNDDYDRTVIIINNDGKIVSDIDKSLIGEDVSETGYYRQIQKETDIKGCFQLAADNQDLYVYYKVEDYNWTIIEVVNNKIITGQINTILLDVILICLASIGCIVFVSILMSTSIAKPLLKLKTSMAKVEQGDFTVRLIPDTHDEIGMIQASFNLMTERLSELFQKTIKIEKEKNKERLRALQYQVNPHFLYNTLNSVRLMAILSGNSQMRSTIDALIRLLKNTIGKNGEMVSITQEINNVNDFVFLQQIKYDGKIQVFYEIDQEISDLIVPNFILQPIVENAIFHGLEPKNGEDNILIISGKRVDDHIEIVVKDNGIGMTEDQLEKVFEEDASSQTFIKIGIKNIHARLRLLFGNSYGIIVSSHVGEGTAIRLILPEISKTEEHKYENDNS